MDINKNLERELDNLGIFELRSLARQVGVKSPTTKKRSELMDKIKLVVMGSELPEIKSRAGRPAKKMVNSEALLSNLMAQVDDKGENSYSAINPFSGEIVFEQSIDYDITALSNQIITVGGILRKTARNSFFFYSCLSLTNKVYVTVPFDIVRENKMVEGDFVFGSAHKLIGKNVAMLNFVEKVNNTDVDKLGEIVSLDYILPEKYISFDSSPLFEGQCYIKEVENKKALLKNIEFNANVLSSQGYECVCLGVELSLESKLTLDRVPNLTTIYSMFDDAPVLSYEAMLDTINHVRALFSRGKKVVLFIVNVANMYPILDMYFSSKGSAIAMGHTMETLQAVKTLIGLAKATKTASVTAFSYYQKDDVEDLGKEVKDIKRNSVEI